MAKKRAHIDAILTSTAASDIFAQDMEEINSERMDERQQLLQTWHELGYELVGPDSWDTEVAEKTARQYGKTPETMTVPALKSAIERMQKALEKKEPEEESDDDFEFDPNADDGLPFT